MKDFAARNPPESAADPSLTVAPNLEVASTGTGAESQQTFISGELPPALAELNLELPTAIGRYAVRRILGAGGFGTVYLCHDAQLDRLVAIKVLHSGRGGTPTETDRLLLEARKLARLQHPGIVTVHDVGTHDAQLYIVSNYVDGQELAAWLTQNSPSWQDSALIVAAVGDALAHAHAHLTVHRDVKPANIILTTSLAPVLVDFGLALDEASAGGRQLGRVAGTPAYMAPEQIAGTAHRIDGRTDVYSLGVVLYEMLCRRLPFRATVIPELLRQIRDDEPQPPRQLAPQVPPELERICLKALAKKLQDRHATAADFADDLRRVAQSAPGSSSATSLRPPSAGTSASVSVELPLGSPDHSFLTTTVPSSSAARHRVRDAERRQVTVLVCGCRVFEDEAYLELDAEDQARVLQLVQQHCELVVRRFDGTTVQCNEQGLLACFGYPVAFEDAALRAARTGLGLIESLQSLADQLRHQHQLELQSWCTIHTGPAVVEANADGISLVGEARHIALRLESVAVPGHVICTDDTHRLFRSRANCTGLGDRRIKGVARPIDLFSIQSVDESRSVFERAASSGLSPLAGRDLEVSLLKERWERAQDGLGQVVLLIGEPGLGKSRLVHTLKEHVLGPLVEGTVDAPVIEWRCSPQFQNTGLFPAIDFYERALSIDREEPPQARFDRLLRRLELYDLAHPETVPLWASLLSLPTPDTFPPLSLTPVRQREETFRAMIDWLHTRAARRPVLFVVEDLHWVDASTLEFLGKFLAEGQYDRILTVLTCRPEFQAPWPAVENLTSLALSRLTRRQAGELMRRQAGEQISEALIEQIYDRSGGVPLFVEEFTKMIRDSKTLQAPAAVGSGSVVLPAHEIPATLQDLISARLDRMDGAHELAQLAATLGREFSHEWIAAVAATDDASLQSELDSLVKAEVLLQKGRPPRCTYMFKHALLEDALYNALIKEKRQGCHRRIAETFAAKFPQTADSRPELLAHHFTEAGETQQAIGFWLKAGLRSKRQSADVEAIAHLLQGRRLLDATPESPERDRRELEFVTALGSSYIAVRGYAAPEIGPVLQRACELAQQVGDSGQQFGIMLGMWEWRLVRGDLRLAVDLAADGMALAERLNDPGMRMEALFMEGTTHYYRGQFAAARGCFEQALAAYDDRERTKFWCAYSGHDAGVTHRCYLAHALWHLGLPDRALALNGESCELARAIGHAFSLGHALDFSALLTLYCGLDAEVLSAAAAELAIATEQGFQLWRALGTLHQAAGMLLREDYEHGLPLFVEGLRAFRATGAELRLPAYLGMLGQAYTQLGRLDEARMAIEEGLAIVEKNDDRCHEAELQRLSGELLLAESPEQFGAAEVWFRRAIETARRQQSQAWELRATMSLARLWQRQGHRQEAHAALSTVLGACSEDPATRDIIDAKALLAGLR